MTNTNVLWIMWDTWSHLVWHTHCPFCHGRYMIPFSQTDIWSHLTWHTCGPFYYVKHMIPFSLTDTLLLLFDNYLVPFILVETALLSWQSHDSWGGFCTDLSKYQKEQIFLLLFLWYTYFILAINTCQAITYFGIVLEHFNIYFWKEICNTLWRHISMLTYI